MRVNKAAFQVLTSPPLNPLPPGKGKWDFLRDHLNWLFENIALCIPEIVNHYELPAMSSELFAPHITDLIKESYMKRSLSVFSDFAHYCSTYFTCWIIAK